MAKITLNDIVKTYDTTLINANFTEIEQEFQNKVLYRNNPSGEPNGMLTNLDMNGRRIMNLPVPVSPNEAARLADIQGISDVPELVAQAEAAAEAAELSATSAATSASTATAGASTASTAATSASASATNADNFATQAANFAAALIGTSSTSTTIGTGLKSFTTQAGKQFNSGQWVIISQPTVETNYMAGTVDSYSGTTLGVNVINTGGSGTIASWNISISGVTGTQGATGAEGPQGPQGIPGSGTSVAVLDEGVSLTSAATSMNFVGAGVTATNAGSDITVTIPGSTGTVTSVSVVNANGFNGSVATSTTTPAITLQTTATGVLKGASNALVAATAGTDFSAGTSANATGLVKSTTGTGALTTAVSGTDYSQGTSALGTGIIKSTTGTGALTIAVAGDFPTLNQNTTGTASNVTGTVAVANGGTGATTLAAKGLLIGNGTSAVGVTNVGTAGQVLTSNGAGVDPSFQTAAGGGSGGWVLLANTNITAVSNLDFLNVFSSTYDDYVIILSAYDLGTSVDFYFRFAIGGTTSANTDYSWSTVEADNGSVTSAVSSASTFFPIQVPSEGTSSTIIHVGGVNNNAAKAAWVMIDTVDGRSSGASMVFSARGTFGSGSIKSGFRLAPSSGNMTAQGYVRVYGIVKV